MEGRRIVIKTSLSNAGPLGIADVLAALDDDPNGDAADAELLQSFKANGWLPHRPAIVDECDNVIAGNRRLRIAARANVPPLREKITFGDGEEADAARLKMALADNSGSSNRTARQRKRFAEYLYAQGKTQQAVADTLGVTQKTISVDLKGFNLYRGINQKHAKTDTNPKGAGRPKSEPARKPAMAEQRAVTPAVREAKPKTSKVGPEPGHQAAKDEEDYWEDQSLAHAYLEGFIQGHRERALGADRARWMAIEEAFDAMTNFVKSTLNLIDDGTLAVTSNPEHPELNSWNDLKSVMESMFPVFDDVDAGDPAEDDTAESHDEAAE
jgi:hypothetical protein